MMSAITMDLKCWMLCLLMCIKIPEFCCTKDIRLSATSWEVLYGNNTTLYCDYDLRGGQLLNIKWYRGTREFFRYEPSTNPQIKVFPIGNVTIDSSKSNNKQVSLMNLDYTFDGPVKCEVLATENYKLLSDNRTLSVISLPKTAPVILTDKEKYSSNDTLIANCTSSLSYPPTSLSFLLNNEPVGDPAYIQVPCNSTKLGLRLVYCENNDNKTTWSFLKLEYKLLPSNMYKPQINLTCTAIMQKTNYRFSVVKILSTNEPKTERVTANNNHGSTPEKYSGPLILVIMTWWMVSL